MRFRTVRTRSFGLALALGAGFGLAALAASPPKPDRWQQGLEKVAAALRAERWKSAEKDARALLGELCDSVALKRAPQEHLVPAIAYLALAEVGLDRLDDARWHWQTGRQLLPELRRFDLTSFPGSARLLAAENPGEEAATLDLDRDLGPTVEPPRRLQTSTPPQPLARRLRSGTLIFTLRAVVGTDGRLRQPRLAFPGEPALVFAGLDTVRQWRFAPATVEGAPRPVWMTLTAEFEITPGGSLVDPRFLSPEGIQPPPGS